MADDPTTEDPAATRPYYRSLGLRVESGEDAGSSKIVLDNRPDLENSRGDVHGGVIASLLDAAISVATRSACKEGEGVASLSLTVNYLEPARGQIVARGRAIRVGRTIASAEASVVDHTGTIVAHAVATLRIIARRP